MPLIDDALARTAIRSFMEGRCDVSSQHKLPTEDEILASVTAGFIGADRAKRLLDEMVGLGVLIRYECYLSDHPIEVL